MSFLPEPRGNPSISPNALQPLANYANNNTSVWALNGAGGGVSGVSQILPGSGISVNPTGGTGVVTVSASAPIISGTTQYVVVDLPTGANSSVRILDTSDPAKFPPSTDYYFTLTSTAPGSASSSCDTTIGQLSAMGIFQIGVSQNTTFASGSGVNTLTTTFNNPRDFYLNNNTLPDPPGIYIYTTSASDFFNCTLIFTWTPATRV